MWDDNFKSCPFCGGTAEMHRKPNTLATIFYNPYTYDILYWVKCSNCGAQTGGNMWEGAAVEAWNRRTIPND